MTTVSGLERTCQECGEPVLVTRAEQSQPHVFHQPCLDVIVKRNERRPLHRWPLCIHGVLITFTKGECPRCDTEPGD